MSAGKVMQALSTAAVIRAQLSNQLGMQTYGGDRNIYQALGYLLEIKYTDYLGRYQRQDISKAIIDRPIRVTWKGDVQVIDNNKNEALEKAWKQLNKDLKLKQRLIRLDKLTCIGSYGVLLLGLNDVQNKEEFIKPVNGTNNKLL